MLSKTSMMRNTSSIRGMRFRVVCPSFRSDAHKRETAEFFAVFTVISPESFFPPCMAKFSASLLGIEGSALCDNLVHVFQKISPGITHNERKRRTYRLNAQKSHAKFFDGNRREKSDDAGDAHRCDEVRKIEPNVLVRELVLYETREPPHDSAAEAGN